MRLGPSLSVTSPWLTPKGNLPLVDQVRALFGDEDVGDFWDARWIGGGVDSLVASWLGDRAVNLAQSSDDNKPTLRGEGTKRWLEFEAGEGGNQPDFLSTNSVGISTAELTVILGCWNKHEGGDNNNKRVFDIRGANGSSIDVSGLPGPSQGNPVERDINICLNAAPTGGNTHFGAGYRQPQNLQVQSSDPLTAKPKVVSYTRTTAVQRAWIDGQELPPQTTYPTTDFTTTQLVLGTAFGASPGYTPATNQAFVGDVYGLFIIDRVLTDKERRLVERYIRRMFPPPAEPE